ncbi:hypothetical protein F4778DRAFT_776695 [Xylariomycetidae sp. FL2044]|nr:hypothetical protein F4778DRAFT_776695 [Xylariomycetidae sp. FL2044]
MHFSTTTAIALAQFLAGLAAATPLEPLSVIRRSPTNGVHQESDHGDFLKHFQDLDGNGKIDWEEMQGGKVAFIPAVPDNNKAQKQKQKQKRADDDDTEQPDNAIKSGSWHDIGNVEGKVADERCFKSGPDVATTILAGVAEQACSALLSKSQAGIVLDRGWYVFHKSGLAKTTGGTVDVIYRYANLDTNPSTPITQSLCKAAVERVTQGQCGKDGKSKGGYVEVDEERGFVVGVDPNDIE